MKELTCLYSTVYDKTYDDVYHIYVISTGEYENFMTSIVKSEKENRILTTIPNICWETLDKMRQKMMEDTA